MPIFSMTLYCDHYLHMCLLPIIPLRSTAMTYIFNTVHRFQWMFHDQNQIVSPYTAANLNQLTLVHIVSRLHQNKVILRSYCYWSNWNNELKNNLESETQYAYQQLHTHHELYSCSLICSGYIPRPSVDVWKSG